MPIQSSMFQSKRKYMNHFVWFANASIIFAAKGKAIYFFIIESINKTINIVAQNGIIQKKVCRISYAFYVWVTSFAKQAKRCLARKKYAAARFIKPAGHSCQRCYLLLLLDVLA